MFFLLRLLFVFAISVAALPPSPHSIDTTISGRQSKCKKRTIVERITLESGVVATRYKCNDLAERMDGLGKRDGDPCTQYHEICGSKIAVKFLPRETHTNRDMCKSSVVLSSVLGCWFHFDAYDLRMSETEPITILFFRERVTAPMPLAIVTASRTSSEMAVVSVA